MSESEESQSSSPPVASEEALLPSDEFSTISKVEEENISGEIEIDGEILFSIFKNVIIMYVCLSLCFFY